MYVDVLWILIPDAGSTPATSTSLRFEFTKNEDCNGEILIYQDEAVLKTTQQNSKLRLGKPVKIKLL